MDTPSGLSGARRYGLQAVTVADPVRARRLDDQHGLRFIGRGTGSPIRSRRVTVVPVITKSTRR
jgi:hypothetical protein